MIVHVVLFRPRPNVSEADREAMFEALRAASTGIPSVRRFQVGARIRHGRPYEQLMTEDYPYAAVVEFDDLAGLGAYLAHPKHEQLGGMFYKLLDAALVYDYEMESVVTSADVISLPT
jgi:hypothetical protein